MEDSKRQKRRGKPGKDALDETLSELMAGYTREQRETLLKGFRILARVAIRAHMERQAPGFMTAPGDDGEEEE